MTMIENMRKNLVLVRAGDRSLHPAWMSGAEREWDLALSYYGRHDNPYHGEHEYLHRAKGSKWEGLADFFRKNPELVEKYDFFWLPDDDILTSAGDINALFERVSKYEFDLSQPSLTLYSYFSHKITLKRPGLECRETNFVEVMVPVFSRKALSLLLETFQENKSGWGLEWLWAARISEAGMRMGIVDCISVHHTRPVGSAGHGGGEDPFKDAELVFEKYNLERFEPKSKKRIRKKKYYLATEIFFDIFRAIYRLSS